MSTVPAYAETTALIAVLDSDLPKARRIVADLHPHERKVFARQLAKLLGMLGQPCEKCGDPTPASQGVTVNALSPGRQYVCKPCAEAAR